MNAITQTKSLAKTLTTLIFCSTLTVTLSASASNEDKHAQHSEQNDEHIAQPNDKHNDQHGDEHADEHGDEHAEQGHIEISADQAMQAGIVSKTAAKGEIKQTITVYGKVVAEASANSQVRARFPGIITKLSVNIGDTVVAGDMVAEVESNNSLMRYRITSPTSGVVTQRNANPGELANEQALLSIANYQQLWVEYQIFPSQAQQVTTGQQVTILSEHLQANSQIKHLIASNTASPFMIARVPLNNELNQFSPGLLLSGSVVVNHMPVPLVVDNRAIQLIDNERVIFVKNEHGFESREIALGQTDGSFSQVLSGLLPGEQYAVQNSYLLKADLGKSSAAHHH
ncbi:efflux RND transporter periplasmic adaptor subunit [Thalassotalea sp. ND16A]|uniref:efflux RND transporter periplasmic adaptor subunit n=1 Tax=Thalassotalea sp. ND16A TaxID=1535422 RepID=UPI00051D2D43|nr:efflux RND transporter periplasmic adaptor subunit [Thalassotalea sp. ND16A]KGJ89454.1 hypothetical protein ND16A_2347 [Thalassotalea sp. ND16A]